MNKLVTKVILGISLVGTLSSCIPQKQEEINEVQNNTLSRTEKIDRTPWSAVDTNSDDSMEQLITYHRNDYYGTNGPVYVRGGGDYAGEVALDMAGFVISSKNKFARMAENTNDVHTYCRVDDFNDDGYADRISWPRLKSMPVYERPFTQEIEEIANRVVRYENYIVDFIRTK